MKNEHKWLSEKIGKECVFNLKKNGFDAHFETNIQEAKKNILNSIDSYNSFGFGGSVTIRKLGLIDYLNKNRKTIYDHWNKSLTILEDLNIRLNQGRCDCFMCSANAISMGGEIVNVDGIGNRTSSITFGPKKVLIVAGINKITHDIESAIARIRLVAAPMRAKSLNIDTPCAKNGICSNCNSAQRICRVTTILHRKPTLTNMSVIIINQSLGY